MSAQLGMSDLFKRILPYGIVCRWQAAHREVAMDRPLFFYPGFGKRLRRIVKFSLPYGLVMSFRERMVRRVFIDSVSEPSASNEVASTVSPIGKTVALPPLPSRRELEPQIVIQRTADERKELPPDVTVVTVIFNIVKGGRAESFRQCLDSVQAQTGVAIEHLIIDGASNDGTLTLLDGYDNTRHSMRVFSAPDKGIYEAMNRGLVLANGRYVTFLNSDDFYNDPLGLHDSVARLDETHAEFSYAPVVMLGDDGHPLDHPNVNPDVNRLCHVMAFSHQSIVMRTDSFRALRGFNISYRSAADYDSVLRMVFAGYHAARVDRSYVTFRAGGYSWTNMAESQAECGRMFSDLYGRYLDYPLTPEEGRVMYVTLHAPMRLADRMLVRVMAAFGLEGERTRPRRCLDVSDRWNVIGLYEEEGWGAWGDREIRLYVTLPDDLRGRELLLSLHIGAYFDADHRAEVGIRCNGRELQMLHVQNFLPARYDLHCPADLTTEGSLVLDVETSSTVRPAGDTRTLGISFEKLVISANAQSERSPR